MPPKERKERSTGFKTWETQARLLAALVASLDNPRLDYKKIAKCYGGNATESSMEHRFRPVKAQADFIRLVLEHGKDPELYKVHEIKNKEEMQKFFGASTPDGLGFQFRGINKGVNVLKQAVANGEDPVEAFSAHLKGGGSAAGSVPATPSSHQRTQGSTTSKRARSGTVPSSKRRKAIKIEPEAEFDDEDEDSPEADYSELDTTPTKPKVLSTPRKNPGQLLPHSAWAKPVEKTAPRPRPVAIAPAPPRPAAPPAYTLAPISGLGSAALANGYTDPATGFGYNCPPPPIATGSAGQSASNSPAAMGMANPRRDSVFSNGSFTAGSGPATPTLSNVGIGMSTAATRSANMTNPAAGVGSNMATSFNITMFESAASPTSASEAHTPQTTASSNTMGGAAADAMAASFKLDDYIPLSSFSGAGSVGYSAAHSADNDTYTSGFDPNEAAFAAEVSFGDFVDQEQWDDAGEC